MKFEQFVVCVAFVGIIILGGNILNKIYVRIAITPHIKKRNQYGTFLYDQKLKMFKAEINWCYQNAVTAYWCCADHSSESGLRIQRYFDDLMVYSPMWDRKVRSYIVNEIFTKPASFHADIRKSISKTKLYEKLIMNRVAVYPVGMVEFGIKMCLNNDQYYVLVLAYLDGSLQTMDMKKIKE